MRPAPDLDGTGDGLGDDVRTLREVGESAELRAISAEIKYWRLRRSILGNKEAALLGEIRECEEALEAWERAYVEAWGGEDP